MVGAALAVPAAWAGFISPGDIDGSFGELGKVTTNIRQQSSTDEATGLVVVGHGKLVAAGMSAPSGGESDFALAGYETNGGPDSDFSGDGLKTTDFNGGSDEARAIARYPNGRLVVAGSAETSPDSNRLRFAVARYKLNGRLDRSFGGDGLVTTRIARNSLDDEAFGVVVGPKSKITVAGSHSTQSGSVGFALARYLPGGRLDRAFSGNGRAVTRFPGGTGQDQGLAIAKAPRGKVVVAGISDQQGVGDDFALARYRAGGRLDESFGGDGRVVTSFGSPAADAHAVVVQPSDGRIVAGGSTGAEAAWAVARYRKDGHLDQSFSDDGLEVEVPGASTEVIRALAIQGNGKILAAGGSSDDFAIARFLSGGGLDPNFSPGPPAGVEQTDFFGDVDRANAIAVQPTGNRVLAGVAVVPGSGPDFALARYHGGG